jgi:hypothetical protein
MMSVSTIQPFRSDGRWSCRGPLFRKFVARAFGVLPALVLLLAATLLVALETPSKPFLDTNSFDLTSAGRGLPQADEVSPDYKTQASALLYGDIYDWDNLNQPDSVAEYLRTYY